MKSMITTFLILLAITTLPSTALADGCTFTKTLYDKKQYKRAFKIAETHARYGNACAKFYLGVMHYTGYGVKNANPRLGVKLIKEASRKGYEPATAYILTFE